jgi:hypothetical protein
LTRHLGTPGESTYPRSARFARAEAGDLPRFVNAIAKRRVVDEHRRRARIGHEEPREPSTSMYPEVHDLLARMDEDAKALGHQTALTSVRREHAGDALLDVARELALNPTTLCQRICRFRRALRTRYLGGLLMLLVGSGALALVEHGTQAPASSTISTSALAPFEGSWRIVDGSKPTAIGLLVSFHDGVAKVQSQGGVIQRTLVVEHASGQRPQITDSRSTWRLHAEPDGAARVRLTSDRGFVVLERVR